MQMHFANYLESISKHGIIMPFKNLKKNLN